MRGRRVALSRLRRLLTDLSHLSRGYFVDTGRVNRHPQLAFYHEVNVFGTRTGHSVRVERGERLPSAPRGFGWRLIEQAPDDDTAQN